jgi:FtsZ-binding cell division protein ZapB
MESKDLGIVLETLAEKIRSLEVEVSLRDYDIKRLKEENERLKKENEELRELRWHLDPIRKREEDK